MKIPAIFTGALGAVFAVVMIVVLAAVLALSAVSSALNNGRGSDAQCSAQEAQTVTDHFSDTNIDTGTILKDCPTQEGDNYIWEEVYQQATALVGQPYRQDAVDALLQLALSGIDGGVNGKPNSDQQAVIDKFKELEKAHQDGSIYKAIADYAKSQESSVSYDGTIGQKIVEAAKSRIGMQYVFGARNDFNPSKQAYCAVGVVITGGTGYECGFDCSSLAGWAVAKGVGIDTSKGAPPFPYGYNGATGEYQYFSQKGHGSVETAADLAPGDLIFLNYAGGSNASNDDHVAIYAGKVNGVDNWIEAPNETETIKERPAWWTGMGYSLAYVRPYVAAATTATVPTGTAQSYAHDFELSQYKWGEDQFTCLVNIWNQESGWRVNAQNASSGAYGIPQALPGNKMASAGSDWQTNYQTQIQWGLQYIKDRYTNPCGAWAHEKSDGFY